MTTRTTTSLLCCLVIWLAAGPVALPAQDDRSPTRLLLTHLALSLRVGYQNGTIDGSAALRVRNTAAVPIVTVPLLLNRLMVVSGARTQDGAPLPMTQQVVLFQDDSSRQVNAIVIRPPRPIPPGDSLAVVLDYHGILVGYPETGSLYIRDHVSPDFTIIREDALAFPVLGVPSLEANRTAPRGSFSFEATVAVPEGQVVAMGGVGIDTIQRDSLISWRYRSLEPVPFLNITIAPYQMLERPEARVFYFPADSAGARMVQRAMAEALARYGRWYGPLGQLPSLAVMEIPEGYGSQASLAAGILQTADAFRDRDQLYQLYHELSHLWNAPDLERPSPRWNEGLASFLQWRMAAELDGWDQWDAVLDWTVSRLLRHCGPSGQCGEVPMADYGKAGLTDRSYSVGMLMFHVLYQVLGPESFDQAYRTFLQRHRTGGTTADLVAAFHQVSPASDRVFADWLSSARWYVRLAAGERFPQMVESYRKP